MADARARLAATYYVFLYSFTDFCRERRQGHALTRGQLAAKSEALWRQDVDPHIEAVADLESDMYYKGIAVPDWNRGDKLPDPRLEQRLWQLSDEELVKRFGWQAPVPSPSLHVVPSSGT